jgi:hypothetical protein
MNQINFTNLKKRLIQQTRPLFSSLLVFILVACTASANNYSFLKEFSVTTPATVQISTAGGNIAAKGSETNKLTVKFIVQERNKILDISIDQLDRYADWDMVSDKNSVTIRINKIKKSGISVSFDIETPRSTSVNFKSSGGNIAIEKLNGSVDVKTDGGNLAFESISGTIKAHTNGGNVALENIKGNVNCDSQGGNMAMEKIEGKVHISTMGGNIAAENISPYLVASTMGGNIAISEVRGYAEVKTAGGNMAFDNVSGSLKAETGGGSIAANILKVENTLILKTSGGNVSVEIPGNTGYNVNLHADKVDVYLIHFDGSKSEGKVEGKINGGGFPVVIDSQSGVISVNFK